MRRRLLAGLAAALLAVAVLPTAAGPSEEEKIEQVVEDVTVAYNLGDLAAMGRHYAPDVAWVPSDYSALLTGWSNVEARFREAHANYSQVQLARENTRIVRNGKVAWASYQWRFAGLSGDQTVQAVGHTTLILEKRGGKWLIVHNHSSLVMVPPEAPPAQPAPAKN